MIPKARGICENCSAEIPKERGRKAIFCSERCCIDYHARKRKGRRRVASSIKRGSRRSLPL